MADSPLNSVLDGEKPRLRVGLVDDDGHFLEAISFALEFSGFKVFPFLDADALLRNDLARDLDCLVLDWLMPQESGSALYQQLRSMGIKTPVVFCTGLDPEQLLSSGVDTAQGIVRKPVKAETLEKAIRAACGK